MVEYDSAERMIGAAFPDAPETAPETVQEVPGETREERQARRDRADFDRENVFQVMRRLQGAVAGERLVIGLRALNEEVRVLLQMLDRDAVRRVEYNAAALNAAKTLVAELRRLGYSSTDILTVLHWSARHTLEQLDEENP